MIRAQEPDRSTPDRAGGLLGLRREGASQGSVARALVLGAILLSAGVAPLLPPPGWKVDALLLAGLLLILAVYLGLRAGQRLGRSSLDLPVGAFLLAGVLATIWSVNPFTSFFPSTSRGEGLLTSAIYLALALAAARLTRREVDIVVTAILIGGALVGVIAMGQYFGVDLVARAGYGPATYEQYYGLVAPASPGAAPPLYGVRSYGTLGNPVFLGGYMVLLLPLAIGAAASGRRWWGSAAAATLVFAALIAAQTRAAWIAAAAAVAVLLLLLPKSRVIYRRLAVLGVVFIAAAVIMTLANPQPGARASLRSRVASTFDAQDASLQLRFYLWRETVPLILRRPVLGWGFSALLGRFPVGTPEYVRWFGYHITAFDSPHNELLQIAFSAGLMGLAAYLWIWTAVGVLLRRMLPTPGVRLYPAAALTASLAAYFLWLQLAWNHVGPANVFWVAVGLVAALPRIVNEPLPALLGPGDVSS